MNSHRMNAHYEPYVKYIIYDLFSCLSLLIIFDQSISQAVIQKHVLYIMQKEFSVNLTEVQIRGLYNQWQTDCKDNSSIFITNVLNLSQIPITPILAQSYNQLYLSTNSIRELQVQGTKAQLEAQLDAQNKELTLMISERDKLICQLVSAL